MEAVSQRKAVLLAGEEHDVLCRVFRSAGPGAVGSPAGENDPWLRGLKKLGDAFFTHPAWGGAGPGPQMRGACSRPLIAAS